MTKREMMEMVAAGKMNEEIQEMAQKILEAMNADKEKRAAKQAEKADSVYAPFIEKFVSALTAEPKTATDILPAFEGDIAPSGKPVSVQFLTSIGGKAFNQGLCHKVDVKVKGKGTQKGYIVVE
ncbi:hypothetical protein IJD44_00850 [bacterium]|nr:hypothetical protein [bacterium]